MKEIKYCVAFELYDFTDEAWYDYTEYHSSISSACDAARKIEQAPVPVRNINIMEIKNEEK